MKPGSTARPHRSTFGVLALLAFAVSFAAPIRTACAMADGLPSFEQANAAHAAHDPPTMPGPGEHGESTDPPSTDSPAGACHPGSPTGAGACASVSLHVSTTPISPANKVDSIDPLPPDRPIGLLLTADRFRPPRG